MQLLVDMFNYHNIKYITEYNMQDNTFIYIASLYSQLYKKTIKYSIINSLLNQNDYIEVFSLPIEISYKVHNEIENECMLDIILNYENKNKIKKKFLPKYILTTEEIITKFNKNNNTNYKIFTKGADISIFKKN